MVVVDFGDLPADGGDGVTRGSINLGAVLFAVAFVVLVVVGGAAVFLLRKRWRRRGGHGYRSVSTDPAEEFAVLTGQAFDQYVGGGEGNDLVTFDQVAELSVQQGLPRSVAESGARKLLKSAGVPEGGNMLTRQEWTRWISRKILKGGVSTREDCDELRLNFGLHA